MPDPSWNTYTPAAPSRFPGWIKVVAVAGALLALLITALATYQQTARRQAWPLARAIAARLATDEGTRDLYARNPDLQRHYPTEQAFLEAVRPLRAGLTLPVQEPRRDRPGFLAFVGPSQARIRVRGEGGTWMELILLRRSAFGPQPRGEGIASLLLADSREGLRALVRRRGRGGDEPDWQRFRDTAALLGTEAGARSLLDRPGVAHSPGDAADFLALRQHRQTDLAGLPATFDEASARIRVTDHRGLFGRDLRIRYRFPGGGSLALAWHDERLTALELD